MRTKLPHIALALVLAQQLLMLGSWLWSAALPLSGVRSMLSEEGIRWFLGHFAESVASPVLVWLLLLAMAYGCLQGCGCLGVSGDDNHRRYRHVLTPLRGALILTGLFVGGVVLLVVAPPGVLLSATGSLWPSPFSRALVPLLALGTIVFAVSYGVLARTFTSVASIVQALAQGVAVTAPLFVVYVLATQFVASVGFVVAGVTP